MDLVPGPFSASTIAALEAVSVVDITSPTELNSLAGTVVGERRVAYQVVGNDNLYTTYFWDSADGAGASSPYVVAGSAGYWIAAGGRYTNSAVSQRSTLLVTGLATLTAGLTTPAQITSTIATGTAPLVVASTTVVANLNVSQLLGATWTAPGTIGSVTPSTGAFTTFGASGIVSLTNTTDASAIGTAGVVMSGGLSLAKSAWVAGDVAFSTSTTTALVRQTLVTSGVALVGGTTSTSTSGGLIQVFGNSHATAAGWGTFDTGNANNAQLLLRNFATSGGSIAIKVNGGAVTALSVDNAGLITLGTATTLTLSQTSGATLVVSSTTDASAVGTASVVLSGGLGIAKKLYVGSSATAAVVVTGGLTFGGGLIAAAPLAALPSNDDLAYYGATSGTGSGEFALSGNMYFVARSSAARDMVFWTGSTTPVERMRISSAGITTYPNATASTTTGTGAVVITGGLGVGGAVNCGALASTTAAHSGVTSVTDTTDATTATAASLKTLGGIGATKNILGKQGLGWGVTSVATAAGTTVVTTASTAIQVFTGVTTQTVTLPAANAFGAGIGFVLIIKNVSTGAVTVNRAGSDTINTTATGATTFNVTTISQAMLVSDGVSAWEKII